MRTSDRKHEIVELIRNYQARNGFPPTVRELCDALGLASPGSLMKHLRALEENGLLVKHTGKKRAWRLTDGQGPAVIPVYGGIAAGLPITAASQKEDEIPVDPVMFGAGEIFALRVKGDSMIDAHIQDGDLAMIRSQRQAENGDVVAALIEGVEAEATLKILRRRPGYIELHPANENYPILTFRGVDQARVRIVGKLAGIIRTRIQV